MHRSADTIARVFVVLMLVHTAIGFMTPYYEDLTLAAIPSGLASPILFLIWFYMVYRNLPALGASELRLTPRWAVIWWFIPIFNLWKPYEATVEIMKGSDSKVGRTDWVTRNAMARPNLILIWWIYSFVSLAISLGALYWIGLGFLSYVEPSFLRLPSLVVSIAGAIGNWLTILVVREITNRQRHKIALMRPEGDGID